MRCLVVGASGLIGSHLLAACEARRLPALGTAYRRPLPDSAQVDVRDAEAVDELVADYQPDVTFLAAGLACPGYAEAHPGECRQVTVAGAGNVARAVARHGGRLVGFSADVVFGDCRTARREDDPVAPSGVLAECQAAAEAVVRAALPTRHLVVRTGWVFGADDVGRGWGGRVVRRLAKGLPVEAAADRHGQPTFAGDLAAAAVELAATGQTGTVHVVGPERHTEFTFARLAAHLLGADVDLVTSARAADLDDGPRPARTWLDRYRMGGLLGPTAVRPTADGLRAVRARMGRGHAARRVA